MYLKHCLQGGICENWFWPFEKRLTGSEWMWSPVKKSNLPIVQNQFGEVTLQTKMKLSELKKEWKLLRSFVITATKLARHLE